MDTTLKQRADEIAELDKKRTQGEWYNSEGNIWFQSTEVDGYGEPYPQQNLLAQTNTTDGNFIAAAPSMAQLIREQQEELEAKDKRIEELESGRDDIRTYIKGIEALGGEYEKVISDNLSELLARW